MSGIIHYATAAIADVAHQIDQAAVQTRQNHERSIATVHANAENFGGQGSEAFQHAIQVLNQRYEQAGGTIQRAGGVLLQANDGMTHAAGQSAAQYT